MFCNVLLLGKSQAEKNYALWLGDVLAVGVGNTGENLVYTLTAKRRPKSISLYIKDEEEEEDVEEEDEEEETRNVGKRDTSSRHPQSARSTNGTSAIAVSKKQSIPNGDGSVGVNAAQELLGRGHRRAIIEQKTRNEQTAEEKRMSRRRDLFQELVTSSTNRLTGLKTDTNLDTKMKSSIAYKGAGQMPKEDDVRKLRLFV
ncbi:unnamed protein product, partial [Schistosoma mattheei]